MLRSAPRLRSRPAAQRHVRRGGCEGLAPCWHSLRGGRVLLPSRRLRPERHMASAPAEAWKANRPWTGSGHEAPLHPVTHRPLVGGTETPTGPGGVAQEGDPWTGLPEALSMGTRIRAGIADITIAMIAAAPVGELSILYLDCSLKPWLLCTVGIFAVRDAIPVPEHHITLGLPPTRAPMC